MRNYFFRIDGRTYQITASSAERAAAKLAALRPQATGERPVNGRTEPPATRG
jgi:hypothetical protein